MAWIVEYDDDYLTELERESDALRVAVAAGVNLLVQFGPQLPRPYADTLKGSAFPNMKELRITLPDGEWRVAFAFDPIRQAILLSGASKSGTAQKTFYERLIRVADRRYAAHLEELKKKRRT